MSGVKNKKNSFKDEYVRRFELLQEMIISCYVDWYILECYQREHEEKKRLLSQHRILYHIFALLKQDLCLNLWKICYDSGKKACTLQALVDYLRKENIKSEYRKSECWKSLRKPISEARNKYLAHSDFERDTGIILIAELKKLLDESRDTLNGLALKGYGVKGLTDISLSIYEMQTIRDVKSLLLL